MKSSIFSQIAELTREHKTAARATAVFLCLALVVTAATVGILTFTGHAMTQQVKVLTCQLTVHEHTPECRDAEGNLVCGYADYVVHIHNDDCYGEDGSLACTLPEIWPHVHTDSCYEEVKTAVCGQEEAQPHAHTEACYDRQQGELICTETEHTHGPECYQREEVLTCDKTEQEHVHNDSCYTTTRDLTCGQEESEEHSHTDECYTETRTLTCDKTTEPHEHGPECYTVNETLICEIPEHVHSDACYNWTETLICQIPEGQIPEGGHVHTDECFETSRELTCGKLENHEHTEECFDHDEAGNRIGNPICGKIELLEHVHGEDCFTIEERTVENAGPFFFETAGEDPEVPAPAYICGKTEHTHDESCLDANGEVICGLEEHVHDDSCLPAAAPEAEAEEAQSSAFVCGKTEHIHDESCLNENGEPVCGLEEHVHDASCVETPENGGAKVFRDANVLITAVYPAEAELPEEATLQAYRLTPESNPADYEEYLEGMKEADSEIDLSAVVLYNIGFYLPDGTEVEPKATVNISIQFLDGSGILSGPVTVVHFADEGTEILESVSDGSSISFDTESFSPFALFLDQVGTVIGLGGEPKTIAAGDPDDLGNYVAGMTLQQKNPESGEWEKFPSGGDLVLGNNYKLTVHFESDKSEPGFQQEMTWSLGQNVHCQPVKGAAILDGNKQIGTYDLTEDGQVTVHFTDEFMSRSNKQLDMTFDLVPTKSEGGGGQKFPWDGEIQYDKVIENTGDLAVQKSAGYYSTGDGTIKYTVEASCTAGMVRKGTLKDTMKDGLTFHGIDSIKVYNADGVDVTDQYKDEIDALMKKAEAYEGNNTWTLEPLPDLSQGMRFVVEYRSDVAADKQKDKEYKAENTVTFNGTMPDGKPAKEKESTATKDLAKDQLTKTGNLTVVGEGENEEEVIQWTVRVGSGQWDPLETDPLEVKDTLGTGLKFRNEPLIVTWYDKDGNVKGSAEIPWDQVAVSGENGNIATYNLSKKLFGNEYNWADGDYLQVTYNTDFDASKQPEDGFANTVENDILGKNGTTGRLPVGESVQKTVVDHVNEGYLDYTIVVEVPPSSHMKSMQGDSGDGHSDLDLPYFYIQDELDFEDKYYALNVPKDITVRVQGKAPSSYDEQFTEAPCDSGTGDGIDRETYQVLEGPNSYEKPGEYRSGFRVFFNTARYGVGTNGKLDRHDSIWDLNFATRLTINYKIPYDTPVVDADGKLVDGLTVGELLSRGMELKNKVISRRSGVDLDYRCYLEKTPSTGNIDKIARILDGGVVEYSVSFVNRYEVEGDADGDRYFKTDDSSDIKKRISTVNPIFEDEFDPRMEYVPGSLHVNVCPYGYSSGQIYATYDYVGDPLDPSSSNKLSAPLKNFTDQSYNDGNPKHYVDKKIEETANEKRTYVFVYQLRLKEQYRTDWEPDEGIKNTAYMKIQDTVLKDDTTVDIPSDMLQKSVSAIGNNQLQYTLKVNELAANLVQIDTGEGTVNLNSYKLVDEMSKNLQLVADADGNYKIDVTYYDEASDSWLPLERSASTENISKSSHNYFYGFDESGNLYFILPDELAIHITYTVFANGTLNSQVLASNKATLYADVTESEEKTTLVEIGSSSATGTGDQPVRLEKLNAENNSLVAGAEFTLYSTAAERSDDFITVTQNGKQVTLYKVKTDTTDKYGAIMNIAPVKDDTEGLYALLETKAPSNFIQSAEPQFFYFPNFDGEDGGNVIYESEEYTVLHAEANHRFVFYNTPEAYSLPESGGEGFGPLYAVGIAMMTLSAVLLLEAKQRRRKGEEA